MNNFTIEPGGAGALGGLPRSHGISVERLDVRTQPDAGCPNEMPVPPTAIYVSGLPGY